MFVSFARCPASLSSMPKPFAAIIHPKEGLAVCAPNVGTRLLALLQHVFPNPHSVAPVRLPGAAAGARDSKTSTSTSSTAPVDETSSDVSEHANTTWSKQQPAAGRQPASVNGVASQGSDPQTTASASSLAADTAQSTADVTAAGSAGSDLTPPGASTTAAKIKPSADTDAAAAADPASTTVDSTTVAAPAAEAVGTSTQRGASSAGSSGECRCPPMETEPDAASARAYGHDYLAICLSVKVCRPAASKSKSSQLLADTAV